jgi:hypothetical protein
MRYRKTIRTTNPQALSGLHPGQWIDYEGAKGRFMGWRNGCIWIAWGGTARRSFKTFARAYRAA